MFRKYFCILSLICIVFLIKIIPLILFCSCTILNLQDDANFHCGNRILKHYIQESIP